MNFDQPRSLRKSMTWVHTWTGLLMGWLLFAIFVTGTLSFYRQELTNWMQPEIQQASIHDNGLGLQRALTLLQQQAPAAEQWNIELPNPRNPIYTMRWSNPGEAQDGHSHNGGGGENAKQTADNAATAQGTNNQDHSPFTHHQRQKADADAASARIKPEGSAWHNRPERRDSDAEQPRPSSDNYWQHAEKNHDTETDSNMQQPNAEHSAFRSNNLNTAAFTERENTARATNRQAEGNSVASEQQRHQANGARGMHQLLMDPATGNQLHARETAGGNFLYQFHYQLYGMPRGLGRTIVGIATLFMFVAIITGVIIHRNIFKDFFSFRPAKGQRSWLDGHAASSVAALPFHLIFTFSGLLLVAGQLLPMVAGANYDGDIGSFMRDIRGKRPDAGFVAPAAQAPLPNLSEILADARNRSPEGISSVTINNPGKVDVNVAVTTLKGELFGGRSSLQTLNYNGISGELLTGTSQSHSNSAFIWRFMTATHMGLFANPLVRGLLFLSGVLGCLMIASGLAMWLVAREKTQQQLGYLPTGHRLVQRLNVAAVAGLILALGGYFWANRLVPAAMDGRQQLEIYSFFGVWLLAFIHAFIRPYGAAWKEQLWLAGVLLAAMPVLNGISGGAFIWQSISRGQYAVAGVDLTTLGLGIALCYTASKIRSRAIATTDEKDAPLTPHNQGV
ncbi:PepSY domain-containing protein [Shewanella yunxiaonensis]|uniref:PepSY domain-containing protein n=1 Tax=Shewanella yunxiaonensis TaxID=2829809 RepID=A0ABX7YU94_9GAMM|nr:PepSY-associated TM helix domain-containing protein [Shewanella yunxiaonensis]QUN06224.1 PepSY domain-containing protein [Shewanella yunxiaonensis]